MRAAAALAALAATLLLAACSGGSSDAPASSPPGSTSAQEGSTQTAGKPALTDLRSIDQFRALFNAEQGTPRLVLLLSPT
ncbi:MAG: hypothetical protein H0W14_06850 [Actinobacteria bacterium]|nr:hypothetical protein [Actinomycetota bacterium]